MWSTDDDEDEREREEVRCLKYRDTDHPGYLLCPSEFKVTSLG